MIEKVSFMRLMAVVLYDAMLVFSLVFLAIGIAVIIGIDKRLVFWLVTLPISYFYFVYSWLKGGQTLGMKSWRVQIVGANFKSASMRFFAAIFSWLIFGLGFIYMLFNQQKLSLHDKISGTYLIYLPKK